MATSTNKPKAEADKKDAAGGNADEGTSVEGYEKTTPAAELDEKKSDSERTQHHGDTASTAVEGQTPGTHSTAETL